MEEFASMQRQDHDAVVLTVLPAHAQKYCIAV